MVRAGVWTVAATLVALSVAACGDAPGGTEGDCNARIGWDGVVYRSHSALNQAAPSGDDLGFGDVLDCDEASVAKVEVLTVSGVDAAVAIRVGRGTWQGVYVASDVPPASWPEALTSSDESSDSP